MAALPERAGILRRWRVLGALVTVLVIVAMATPGVVFAATTDDIKLAQSDLNGLAYNAGAVDGVAGPQTRAAVQAFQGDRCLDVDGLVGPQTLGALGAVIKLVQAAASAVPSGEYNAATKAAVATYQASHGLPADGIAGADTMAAMGIDRLDPTCHTAQVSGWPAQTIDGVGASGAWWPNDLAKFSTSAQQAVADLLFGSQGIQLSAYRYNIGGGGVGVTVPDRAPQTMMTSVGSYDWSHDPGGTTFVTDAAHAGVPTIIGFVTSAPAAFTTNGKSCGGSLISGDEQAYADYLSDIVDHFAAQGVSINYVSPMNEPDNSFSSCGQEGMSVDASQRATIVRTLGATLAQRSLPVGISADESSRSNYALSEWPAWMSASGVSPYVATLAHHTYDWPDDGTMTNLQSMSRLYGKPSWATEICCHTSMSGGFAAQYDPTIVGALPMANEIYRDFALTNDTQFHWFEALSNSIGCDPSTSSTCATTKNTSGWNDGLIYYDPNYAKDGNQALYPTKRYYVLGQYSKFIRPGSVRFAVTGTPSGVSALATSNSGKWTVVVTNVDTATQSFHVHFNALEDITATAAYRTSATQNIAPVGLPAVSDGVASLTVPGQSVTTYVFAQNGGTAVKAGASAVIGAQSKKCLDITGGSTADDAPTQLNTCDGAPNQGFSYTPASELRVLGKCLDAYRQGTVNGTSVVLYTCNGGANQKWTLSADGEIRGVQSNLCLDAHGQGTANGTAVDLWSCNGGANEQWARPDE
ncbi:glycoside hydrolase [Rugosimonospora africana]|uniref:Ricin B lectin domain-containing protein n=1 Tax=Rugosimonospora africana TaxID=556532 RepID=A0A8J3QVL2_9ACTN|nr:glycoside hydrolase [Rugosimonospora africana]GIH17204.1 hypothetical protein Raf01_53760 [Rugosimonospora africana]